MKLTFNGREHKLKNADELEEGVHGGGLRRDFKKTNRL